MAMACLGNSVDVLVGGADLTFPHHAYQSAMVEAASGVSPFARAVVHVGEVRLGGQKMAKSTGNLVLIGEVLERHSAPAVRLALLHRAWDQPWECADVEFERAAALLDELHSAAGGTADGPEGTAGVRRLLLADLDVPGAVGLALSEGGVAARYLIDVLKIRAAPLT